MMDYFEYENLKEKGITGAEFSRDSETLSKYIIFEREYCTLTFKFCANRTYVLHAGSNAQGQDFGESGINDLLNRAGDLYSLIESLNYHTIKKEKVETPIELLCEEAEEILGRN